MAELQLKSHRFREEREADWRRLEKLLDKLERSGVRSLGDQDLLAIPVLYRSTLSSLSVARSMSLDRALVEYLDSLCVRAYFLVYGARSTLLARVAGFFAADWPRAVRGLWRETLVCAALVVIGAAAGYLLVRSDPEWFYAFVPRDLAGGRDPTATAEMLRSTLYDAQAAKQPLSAFAAFLFTHNAQIAIFSFALGFAFCLPTGMLMIYNGCMVGAFLAVFAGHGLGWQAGGWLMIHGVSELFAVILAGAAGLRIGWAVVFPGRRSRLDAAASAGRNGAMVMAGVVIMLMVAGLLEGVGRQLVTDDIARYAIALTSAVVWGVYFYAPWRALLVRRR
jgi:uncharacterized membrane protein SpoIIM required for sporulation